MAYSNPAPYPSLPHVGGASSAGEAQQHYDTQRDNGDAYPYDPRPSASNGSAPGAFTGLQDGFQRSVTVESGSKAEQTGQTEAQTDAQKGNRLRKACDSCSIRKVKASTPRCDNITSEYDRAGLTTRPVRRIRTTMPSMRSTRDTMHIRTPFTPTWSSE